MRNTVRALLVSSLIAPAYAGIESSKDGGATWAPFEHAKSSGIERIAASGEVCADSVVAPTADGSTLNFQKRVPYANPGSNSTQQSFFRFYNPNDATTQFEVYGIDDDGVANKSGPVSFSLGAQEGLHFTSQDLENGNADKGLAGSFCDGSGKWQLIVRSDNSIGVMSLMRAPGGFLTSMNETVPSSGNDHYVYFVKDPAETTQQSFVRILNLSTQSGTVTVTGYDDAGNEGGTMTFTLAANDAQQLNSSDIEAGNTDKGLSGSLGEGDGNWRLVVSSDLEMDVMSIIRLPGGYLSNLSAIAPGEGNSRKLTLVEPADQTSRNSSLRIMNTSNNVATVTISATDDDGAPAPGGDVTMTLSPNQTQHVSIADLESGNINAGISGMLGDGNGRWRMTVASTDTLEVMSLVETTDNLMANISRAVPSSGNVHEVPVFNPASNTERRSSVRVTNETNSQAAITITGYDDAGNSEDTPITFDLPGQEAMDITAQELEAGDAERFAGAFGDGAGKWRLTITATQSVSVQGTLDNTAGFITNLSRATEGETIEEVQDSFAYYEENISSTVQQKCIICHVANGVAGLTRLLYVPTSESGYLETNYNRLESYVSGTDNGGQLLLDKARGISHGGGAQMSSGDQEFENLTTFVDLLGAEASVSIGGPYWDGVTMASPEQTARRASMLLRGSPLSTAERNAIAAGGESALRSTIRGMMEGDEFHEFLTRGANDRLLTDAFINNLFFEAADTQGGYFPDAANRKYNEAVAAGGDQNLDWNDWQQQWYWGMARAPVELIAYVVKNDRSYQEVVTADYMMVNYITNDLLNAGNEFSTTDPALFKTGTNNGQILNDDQTVSEFRQGFGNRIDSHSGYIDYPHAGVLNSLAFLNRYPTTETNRNRARARWTYYHFLGVDIEKSAERTTDPVALADTNNPTMNNPACTVCHQIMDPVAGAYQNYGNSGIFRDAWGGMDALPDTYKHPEWFGEDAESSEYQEGDTWFRDMRIPGFDGDLVPDADSSLQWLAEQIADDPRFATASVSFWWPALMGSDVLEAPANSSDYNFSQRLAAFEEQNDFIEELGASFASGINGGAPYNAKDLLTEMMMSPWFRASEVESAEVSDRLVSELGIRRLLTPEELEKKTASLIGWAWGDDNEPDEWEFDGRYTQLGNRFNIYYGGIDSNGITDRSSALTSLMVNVAERQALAVACPAVMIDFAQPDAERLMFGGIEPNMTPATEVASEFAVSSDNIDDRETFQLAAQFSPGEKFVEIRFLNDWYDEDVGDRNLQLYELVIRGPDGTLVNLSFNQIDSYDGATYECGGATFEGFTVWSSCTVSIPFTVTTEGQHTLSLVAWGEQAGPDDIEMSVAVSDSNPAYGNSAGGIAIKEKLVQLHNHFLGEALSTDDAEIDATYGLLVDTWEARQDHIAENGDWAWNWPDESCDFPRSEFWEGDDAVGNNGNDPSGMKNTWASILIYLMSDFDYLHE
ncbi:MAG: DUF1588 domain-containing protein [Pseudomonadales bacterium]|nr:DUF1588 domain-containing protein [Pseudomonadales bacterium]